MKHFKIIIKKDRLVFYTRVWESQWRRVADGKFIYCFLPCKNPNFYTIRLLYRVNKYSVIRASTKIKDSKMKSTYKISINAQLSCVENINEKLTTHYLIYKISNNLNGRYYIGQHQTTNINDGYLGSGKLIRQATEKYDLSCFTKIFLYDFDNFNDMHI